MHIRLGRVIGVREPGLRLIVPITDRPGRVSTRIVTMPIQPRASNASKSTQFNGRLPEAKLVVPMLH
ncbi:hypothetical protein B1T45_03270 [Mycobacterium kansasii]|uniref:Uncharacterized protein n=3 Tax=Mycobacterium kansasii TaxID=1768 RepID=U5X2Q7_MYCKA|nr:hypothetical protein MKAN_25910 [Mycobacterium kansasii ATCC 12478]ARG55037.1 hypothetical protein B1T43_03200 [Mycobacterium kansasii]EUA21679.1 putative membrane domain protein [Mycobacterium kansasii 662]ARG60489.1 hypothetical protein B1T45_03270 [Mycobacterium kansasii]ARG68172.1 hypothetical protein B1T47_03000 [Mycobacterium kansasii]